MSKTVLYEPSIGSDNLGDQIIVDAVKKALNHLVDDSFILELPTHTPANWRYLRFLEREKASYKIICGSNILVGKINNILHLRQWAVPMFSIPWYGPIILVGVGSQQYNQKISLYTRFVYNILLKKDFIHSVRDSYTEEALKKIGIKNVINTACPTMWDLTEDHCRDIPVSKSAYCICTFTDYKKNEDRDNTILMVLKSNYKHVFFWAQGNGDSTYFKSLRESNNVTIIPPNLNAYNKYLDSHDTDYVGTRLHGGIRALQKKRRTLIIGIDNRAIELQSDFGIPVITQENIGMLDKVIKSKFNTEIKLPTDNINKFLSQFNNKV